jgi:type II secretory ATPase GspE/PulE/Tfp pilus assembly ATPase PilB-like protein
MDAPVDSLIACRADVFPPVAIFALRAGQARYRIPETLVLLADCFAQAADLGMTLTTGEEVAEEDAGTTLDQAPVVRIVDSILRQASKTGASEVSIKASDDEGHALVAFNVDGSWDTAAELPMDALGPICRRICVMAGINWHLKQPALGNIRVGERSGDPQGSVRFLPGEREAELQVHVTLTSPDGGTESP